MFEPQIGEMFSNGRSFSELNHAINKKMLIFFLYL